MKILLIKTVPGEMLLKKITYNYQELGIAKALIRKGHQCDIMCCADHKGAVHKIELENGRAITLYCMESITILKNGIIYAGEPIFRKYDLLHASEYNQIYTWHLAKKYKDKTVVWHGPYYSEFNKNYNRMCMIFDLLFKNRYVRLNTQFLTKSALATKFLKNKGVSNIDTIGVGIDIEALTEAENSRLDFVDEINRRPGRKLLYAGRLEPRRNPFFLLDILKKCIDSGENCELVIVGKGEKFYVDKFFESAKKMGVLDRIIYCESVEQKYMSQIYNTADVFLLPTIYDIFGMVLLEAMYFGKVVITTKNGGSSMLIDNGKNGFVIEKFDADSWHKIIQRLFQKPEMLEQVGENAHVKILQEYTWDVLADKLLAAYRRKTGGR